MIKVDVKAVSDGSSQESPQRPAGCRDACAAPGRGAREPQPERDHVLRAQQRVPPQLRAHQPGRPARDGQGQLQQRQLHRGQVHAPGVLRDLGAVRADVPQVVREGALLVGAPETPEPLDQEGVRPGVQGVRLQVRKGTLEEGPGLGAAAARLRDEGGRQQQQEEEASQQEQLQAGARCGSSSQRPAQAHGGAAHRSSPCPNRESVLVQRLVLAAGLGVQRLPNTHQQWNQEEVQVRRVLL